MASELTKRVAVAAVGVPIALGIIYAGGWVLALALAALAAGGYAELSRMAAGRGVRPFLLTGVVLASAPVLLTLVFPGDAALWSWRLFVAATIVVLTAAIFRRGVEGAPLAAAAVTLFGALFLGGTLSYAVLLRELAVPHDASWSAWVGPALIAFPMTLTWLSDTFAYFGGRAWGRHKLIPSVSPGKTREGAISGVVGSVLVGALYAHFVFGIWLDVPIGAAAGALGGLLLSPTAQLGDLAESLLKREAGVKDSGALLPGHGGILDRFDSLFFAYPVSYWFLLLVLSNG